VIVPPVAIINAGPVSAPKPKPFPDPAPNEPIIGIFLISSYYANCVCAANTVKVEEAVLIAVNV
jgi:hypothetical protein